MTIPHILLSRLSYIVDIFGAMLKESTNISYNYDWKFTNYFSEFLKWCWIKLRYTKIKLKCTFNESVSEMENFSLTTFQEAERYDFYNYSIFLAFILKITLRFIVFTKICASVDLFTFFFALDIAGNEICTRSRNNFLPTVFWIKTNFIKNF